MKMAKFLTKMKMDKMLKLQLIQNITKTKLLKF